MHPAIWSLHMEKKAQIHVYQFFYFRAIIDLMVLNACHQCACIIISGVPFLSFRSRKLCVLDDTGAKSFQMDVRGPWIAAGDFESRFGLDLALKDVRLGCEMAETWENDAKTMRVALDYFKVASESGYGKEDCNAVYKIIKKR